MHASLTANRGDSGQQKVINLNLQILGSLFLISQSHFFFLNIENGYFPVFRRSALYFFAFVHESKKLQAEEFVS